MRKHKSFWLALVSFCGLAILMTSTNPIDNIIYAAFFFILLFTLLVSFGFLILKMQTGEVSRKNRYAIVIVSLIILILMMFRSAQSLNWVDALILVLIAFGLVFYISKRSY